MHLCDSIVVSSLFCRPRRCDWYLDCIQRVFNWMCQRTSYPDMQTGVRRQITSSWFTDASDWERFCQFLYVFDCSDAFPPRSRNSCWTTSAGTKRRIRRFEKTNKFPDSPLHAWSADSQDRCELCSFGINGTTSAQSLIVIVRSGTFI